MQVNRVQSNNYNAQTNFKGYVDQELVNYVKKTSNSVIKNILEKNDYKNKLLSEKTIDLIKKVSTKGDEILEVMENSVKDLHPQSRLHHYIQGDVEDRYTPNPKYTVRTQFYLDTACGLRRWNLSKRLQEKDTPENRFLELIETVLKKDDSKFTPSNMKELETDTVYDWVNAKLLFRNLRARMVAPKFNLPKDWFKTKKAQIAAEDAKREAEEAEQRMQRRKESEIRRKKLEEEIKIRDRIKNQNLETIKDYLK